MREAPFTASILQACSAPDISHMCATQKRNSTQRTYGSPAFRRNPAAPACVTAPRIPEPAKAGTTIQPWVRGGAGAARRSFRQAPPVSTRHCHASRPAPRRADPWPVMGMGLRATQRTYCSTAFRRNLAAPACVTAPRIPEPANAGTTKHAPRTAPPSVPRAAQRRMEPKGQTHLAAS